MDQALGGTKQTVTRKEAMKELPAAQVTREDQEEIRIQKTMKVLVDVEMLV